ncbi:MAG: cyanophycinase [Bacteroidota bacterium]
MEKINLKIGYLLLSLTIMCCSTEEVIDSKDSTQTNLASIGIVGNSEDTEVSTSSGILLMGGGKDVDQGIQWMIDKAKGGDFVVLRASGGDAYNDYIYNLGDLNSVETFRVSSKILANNEEVANSIRAAEALFIAGGNQADYVRFWKNTLLEDAINYLINEKKAPVGGTSAGCAILGGFVFDALKGTVYSDEALENPYIRYVSLQNKDFIDIPILSEIITDTHYNDPDRRGRHITFLARIIKDWQLQAKGIGIQEETAVAIDETSIAKVFGRGSAYFLAANNPDKLPEIVQKDTALTWNHEKNALKAIILTDNKDEYINLSNWKDYSSETEQTFYVIDGKLFINNQ